eukprot:Partr_v1_DN25557_c0_g1_i1_m20811 putative H ACA ribonucleoprotein complex subunit
MAKESSKEVEVEDSGDNKINISPISHPLATSKLQKKIYKTIKKASKKKHVKRGVKEVVKALRKGEKGIVLLAGDISPLDVISHLPIMCEEANVPYCYVASKQSLGESGMSKRPTSVIMIDSTKAKGSDYEESFDLVKDEISKMIVLPSVTAQ